MSDDTKKVSVNREKKEAIVADLVSDVERAKALVFTNYQGLTHKQIEDLKKAVKPLDANLVVAKNTLLKIALEKGKVKIDEANSLEGPTGTLFLFGDVIEPLKKLAKTIKDFNLPTIKFAIIDGKVTSAEDVIKLSALPSREVLLTQVVVALKSPISGLHRALNWNLQKLVMTLSAVAQAKPQLKADRPLDEAVVAAATSAAESVQTETPTEDTPSEPVSTEAAQAPAEEVSQPATEEAVSEVETEAATEEPAATEETKTETVSEGGEN